MDELTFDQQLLAALRTGNPAAFEQLYVKYYPLVKDLVFKLNGSNDDAQDIFQETLFVFVKKIREPAFTLSSKVSTFLYAIARNIYLKKIGKAASEVSTELKDFDFLRQESEPEVASGDMEQLFATVQEKINELEADCRNIILYAFYQKLSHAHIAELTGYTETFVKVKKFRCLEYLRRMVKATGIYKDFQH